jgi:hypothetical protein
VDSAEKWFGYSQLGAATVLAVSYFLPLYSSRAPDDSIRYAGEAWGLYFWTLPAMLILQPLNHRWLRVAFCISCELGVVGSVLAIVFLATYKRMPLIGFDVAMVSFAVLGAGWLALGLLSLCRSKEERC